MVKSSAVVVDDLVVNRGGRQVLRKLSLEVGAGSVTGLVGPSGSGKTTLIRCIAGIQVMQAGHIDVLGEPAGSPRLRRRIGYVTQASSVYPDLTVQQNLQYFASLAGVGRSAILAARSAVGLDDKADDLVSQLSGGQRIRVSLAATLLADPDLYLLDEPTVGLDPVLRRDLWQLFRSLAAEGKTLIVSSHVMDEAARCDRVVLMREGRLVAYATPAQLRESTGRDDLEEAFLVLAERSSP